MPTPRPTFLDFLPADLTAEEWESVSDFIDSAATTTTPHAPFEYGDMQFMLWLTRAEWQFAYCLSTAWHMTGYLQGDLSISESMRAVIFHAAYYNGYDWSGVDTVEGEEELEVVGTVPNAVEPRNMMWVVMIAKGRSPNDMFHFPEAIKYAESKRQLTPYVSDLEAALSQLRLDVKSAKANPITERERELLKEVQEIVH